MSKEIDESKQKKCLIPFYDNINNYELGIDEAGRGPMFGRVYTAAVILPKDNCFDYSLMKDSKKFTSKKKLKDAAEYIKKNALAWSISWEDEKVIDKINIRQANFKSMHKTIDDILKKFNNDIFLLVDGNDFKPYIKFINNEIKQLPYICIKGGDNKYCAIAAASILAKVARDEYIEDLCKKNEYLNTYYDIGNNKGYGTKKHLDGINKYGISKWHRKTYGICKHAPEINI